MTSSYVRFAGSGGDEWNGILVEVIGSFSDFSCRDSLPALLPETLARLAAVYGGEERRPMPATPPSPPKKTASTRQSAPELYQVGHHPAILDFLGVGDEEMTVGRFSIEKECPFEKATPLVDKSRHN